MVNIARDGSLIDRVGNGDGDGNGNGDGDGDGDRDNGDRAMEMEMEMEMEMVMVMDITNHIGDGFKSSVWMPWKASWGPNMELVEQQKWIESTDRW